MHNHYEAVIDNNRVISAAWRIRNISLQALDVQNVTFTELLFSNLVITYSRNNHQNLL